MGAIQSRTNKKQEEPVSVLKTVKTKKRESSASTDEEKMIENKSICDKPATHELQNIARHGRNYDHVCENAYMILFLKEIGKKLLENDIFPLDLVYHIASILIHKKFIHETNFDENGILFWLGSFEKTAPYQHPLDIGLVKISPSRFYCGTAKQAFCHTMPLSQNWLETAVPNSWAEIEFLHHSVIPTAYTLRHGYPIKGHALRHWNFEARNPNEDWEILFEHRDDKTIPGENMDDTATFFLPEGKIMKQYSIFRIYQTGETADNSPYLMMAGFEIYGYLFS